MKIRYLGTAAAEGLPALFCSCDTCKKARSLGGRNIRMRAQALIDDTLLMDLGPDLLAHSIRFGIDLTKLQHCLVTHNHEDHFYEYSLHYIRRGCFSTPPENWVFRVYANDEIIQTVNAASGSSSGQLEGICVEPFRPFAVGKYTVTALKALHGAKDPYVYAISDGSKTLLYAHDSDIFPDETWAYLKVSGLRFDLVSMDCTEGAMESIPYQGHMCLGYNRIFRQKLMDIGAADKKTVFVSNHFSHNGKDACYDDYAPLAEKDGILTSYDGMEIEF